MSALSNKNVKRPALKRYASMAENIFARLVEALVTGELPAGEPLREAQVAKQWGVSRTPMREAVRRASEAGLLISSATLSSPSSTPKRPALGS